MNWTGFRKVAIKSLKLPGDIKDRMHRKHVKELAESIAKLGDQPGNPPWVQNKTRVLVAGRDRIAACMINKLSHVWVRMGDFEEGDIQRAERDENLRRRDVNREKLLAEAVKQEEQEIKAAEKEAAEKAKAEGGTSVPPKKKAAPKKAAREKVAAKAGIKPESVRKAEQRARKKEKTQAAPKTKPPIETMGREMPKGLTVPVTRIQEACQQLSNNSKASLTALSKVASILPGHVLERLRDLAQQLGDAARAAEPSHLCPKCYGEGTDKCPLCKGAHYARSEQMDNVPKEWLLPPAKDDVNGVTEASA